MMIVHARPDGAIGVRRSDDVGVAHTVHRIMMCDALQELGASDFVNVKDEAAVAAAANTLDLIIVTFNVAVDFTPYFNMLRPHVSSGCNQCRLPLACQWYLHLLARVCCACLGPSLVVQGTLVFVGAIIGDVKLPIFGPLIMKQLSVAGSATGGRGEWRQRQPPASPHCRALSSPLGRALAFNDVDARSLLLALQRASPSCCASSRTLALSP